MIVLGTVFCIPSARNTIVAGVRALFAKEVPEDAIDAIDYEQQGCTLFDLSKGAQIDYMENYAAKKWFSKGFTINVQVGDNAYGHTESTCVFKADEERSIISSTTNSQGSTMREEVTTRKR